MAKTYSESDLTGDGLGLEPFICLAGDASEDVEQLESLHADKAAWLQRTRVRLAATSPTGDDFKPYRWAPGQAGCRSYKPRALSVLPDRGLAEKLVRYIGRHYAAYRRLEPKSLYRDGRNKYVLTVKGEGSRYCCARRADHEAVRIWFSLVVGDKPRLLQHCIRKTEPYSG